MARLTQKITKHKYDLYFLAAGKVVTATSWAFVGAVRLARFAPGVNAVQRCFGSFAVGKTALGLAGMFLGPKQQSVESF